MGLVVSALIINWAMISIIHLMFRRAKARRRQDHGVPQPGLPADQLPDAGLPGGHPGGDVPDAGPAHFGLPDSGLAGVLGVSYRLRQKNAGSASPAASAQIQ
jgi:aromatic amino acid transport protein AroP